MEVSIDKRRPELRRSRFYRSLREFHVEYQSVVKCPLCSHSVSKGVVIPIDAYRFGDYWIDIPRSCRLVKCVTCGLYYKTLVPTQESLRALFQGAASSVWNGSHDSFNIEIGYVDGYLGTGERALLDIGSADGAFLRAAREIAKVRSALDVYKDDRCSIAVNGEYLLGFLESPELRSEIRYDVITAFDVFEHFYAPSDAVRNLRQLLADGGYVFGETGDSSAVPDQASWWYVQLIEHHIFWNPTALNYLCAHNGFELHLQIATAHKGRRYMSAIKRLLALGLHMTRDSYVAELLWKAKRVDASMIGNPYKQDHILFALRKK